MPIKIGENALDKIYVGTASIKEVYIGKDLFWSNAMKGNTKTTQPEVTEKTDDPEI